MVYLNKIYTKTGDQGQTALGTGDLIPKTDLRIAAYGGVDELNSMLGVCLTCELPEGMAGLLKSIQNDLFDLGADLCVPESTKPTGGRSPLRVVESQVSRLEKWIDEYNAGLAPLTSFILPGGSRSAAHLHLARAVCRRVELGVCRLRERDEINPQAAIYLNRLSDLLFVLARVANGHGENDVLWTPGGAEEGENGRMGEGEK